MTATTTTTTTACTRKVDPPVHHGSVDATRQGPMAAMTTYHTIVHEQDEENDWVSIPGL